MNDSLNPMTVTIIVPTLNELAGMKEIMPRIKPEWYDQLIVLDGQSGDGTLEWAKTQGYETFCQSKPGLWSAFQELYESGMVEGDVVITFSPDGNSVPEVLPALISKIMREYDMVIASRYKKGAHSDDDTFLTRIGNFGLTLLCNIVCRWHYTDALVMYRAYRRDIITRLGFMEKTPRIIQWLQGVSCLTSWESPMSIRAAKQSLRIAEIPADEPPNITLRGKRRQNIFRHGFAILMQILYEGFRRKI